MAGKKTGAAAPGRPTPHPRLYIGPEEIARARGPMTDPLSRGANRRAAAIAEESVSSTEFPWTPDTHNGHLLRARTAQTWVVTLLLRWIQTREERFRAAALAHVGAMAAWEYWSWIAWRQGDPRPDAIFDLSYGENSATLAIAWDLLHPSLSPAEREIFLQEARRRAFAAFLANAMPGKASWWPNATNSNWLAVCAGGAGMLALSMLDELPEARTVLERVEEIMPPFLGTLESTGGGWPEGTGYWNYGMRYAFMYHLSRERALGTRDPLLDRGSVRATLSFCLDFSPRGAPCSFGDVNTPWRALPIHIAAAVRAGRADLLPALAATMTGGHARETWPNAAETVFLNPGIPKRTSRTRWTGARRYPGIDWVILADRMPGPRVYLSARGGSSKDPHAHLDLLSFHCVVGRERLVSSLGNSEYLDTTFGARRFEIHEIGPASKNGIFVNGVGVRAGSAVSTRPVRAPDLEGFLMDATDALSHGRPGEPASLAFCGRLFLMVARRFFLILDRTILVHHGRVESRIHTTARAALADGAAVLRGDREALSISFAASRPSGLHTAADAMTRPEGPAPTMLRWCTDALVPDTLAAALLTPGGRPGAVSVRPLDGGFEILVETAGLRRAVAVTDRLSLRRTGRGHTPGR